MFRITSCFLQLLHVRNYLMLFLTFVFTSMRKTITISKLFLIKIAVLFIPHIILVSFFTIYYVCRSKTSMQYYLAQLTYECVPAFVPVPLIHVCTYRMLHMVMYGRLCTARLKAFHSQIFVVKPDSFNTLSKPTTFTEPLDKISCQLLTLNILDFCQDRNKI